VPGGWDAILAAYTGKFGKPDRIERSTVQNGYGANFDDVHVLWANKLSTLQLKKRCGAIDKTCVDYFETDGLLRVDRQTKQRMGALKGKI
jgi:hypothetical protein